MDVLWLVPALPLAGFVLLLLAGGRLSRAAVRFVGAGSVGAAAALTVTLAVSFMSAPPPGHAFNQRLWEWMQAGDFKAAVGLRLDPLSVIMVLVVTVVGFLIHVYAGEYMAEDPDIARFFAEMNLFVGAMLILVLADNLVLLLLGWEGVGLCSYLLIGFWYQDPANGRAARKAFVVTRIGDVALTVGIFLIFWELGTVNMQEVAARAAQEWPRGSGVALAAALLLLGGAMGKSAQLPLQTWLPDAMAGPTPVSALIHAATMVTAGVYLIARMHVLFELAPVAQLTVAVVGAATLTLGGLAALAQHDIKRVLAYSTISQIGYMFLALGVGAWSAAIFHLMTHACFKALLFLGAGAVILACHDEHDIYAMGGLRRQLPVTFWTFVIASAALSGFPLVTAGFYSKDLILSQAFSSPSGAWWLWAAGWVTALLTAIYIFKVVFVAFFGKEHVEIAHHPGLAMQLPMVVLAVFSVAAGFVELPHGLHVHLLTTFLHPVLPALEASGSAELALETLAAAASLGGIAATWYVFQRRRGLVDALVHSAVGGAAHRFFFSGLGFDALYDAIVVRPFLRAAELLRADFADGLPTATAYATMVANRLLAATQNGRVRFYAAGIVAGAALLLALVVLS